MNHFQLTIPEPFHEAHILIDGVPLIDALTRIETPYAAKQGHPKIAGQYSCLPTETSLLPSKHFLGGPRPIFIDNDKTTLLICDCGCEGCWDFVCRITITPETITWSDFEQVHRDWDYSELGTLVFDRTQYEAELSQLRPTPIPLPKPTPSQPTRVAFTRTPAQVIGVLKPGFLRVHIGNSDDQFEGGIPVDVPLELVPFELRLPNSIFILVHNNATKNITAVEALGHRL